MSVDIHLCWSAKANIHGHRHYEVRLHCGSLRKLDRRSLWRYNDRVTIKNQYSSFSNSKFIIQDYKRGSLLRHIFKINMNLYCRDDAIQKVHWKSWFTKEKQLFFCKSQLTKITFWFDFFVLQDIDIKFVSVNLICAFLISVQNWNIVPMLQCQVE